MAGASRTLGSLFCALALAGCSGTPLGDQLARSFSAPPAQPAQPVSPAPNPATATPALGTPTSSTPASSNPASPKKAESKPVEAKTALNPSKPAPYRITIQLPSADPAAPAEAVTEALRAAGVSFEVEMIERVGAAATPVPVPAPAPR